MSSTYHQFGRLLSVLLMCSLQGCALDPAGIGVAVFSSMSEDPDTPQGYAETYIPVLRGFSCDEIAGMSSRGSVGNTPGAERLEQGRMIAVRQVQAEKNCSVSGIAGAQPNAPVAITGYGSVSAASGLPQTSIAQWIAQETPQKYQGKSCDYLLQALARSEQMEASDSGET